MSNERITENLVRNMLLNLNYSGEGCVIEEQASEIDTIKKLLKNASKSGKGNQGRPEFIITHPSFSDSLIVIECKAKKEAHEQAVSDVNHYASFLSPKFTVISVAVSGEKNPLVSVFLSPKGSNTTKEMRTKHGVVITDILSWSEFYEHATFNPDVQKIRENDLVRYAQELHILLRDEAELSNAEKPLVVSGTLIALRNSIFRETFHKYTPAKLQREWMSVIREEIDSADIPESKKKNMSQPYSAIEVHEGLGKSTKKYPQGILHLIIEGLDKNVFPYVNTTATTGSSLDFDIAGRFYQEFLKYASIDQGLGIVLTPRHITELFSLLGQVDKNSRVLDICTGTAGFLVSAMHQMFKDATTEEERDNIRRNGLVGVEQRAEMYALAASNMILRGDGKANLHQGSCMDDGIASTLKTYRCDVGMINPPYSKSAHDLHELRFIEQMLDCMERGGTGIAIVPMSCAIAPHVAKGDLLRKHTLEAVMSMPEQLFYPVGTVTCIMVFTAHVPHNPLKETWFGYWKDDGFVQTKTNGRCDLNGTWETIRNTWVSSFLNRKEIPGQSVTRCVTENDEWCVEAYLNADYTNVSETTLMREIKKFLVFNIMDGEGVENEVSASE